MRIPLSTDTRQTSPPLLLLGLLIALPALGTDLFVPSLPTLARSLGAPVSTGQLALTAYFAGLAGGMLVWGPLSDRFGRKPVLLAGLGTMLVASLAASMMVTITGVAAARLAQGLAMSSGAVIVRSIVRDLHAHEQAARLLARVTIVFSIVPIAAPLLGSQLAGQWGWQSVFWGMALAAAALLASALLWLRETAPWPRRSIHPLDVARTLAGLASDRRLLPPLFLMLSTQMGLLAWVSNSAFTLVRGLGVSTGAYGWMFALVMLGQITGAWSSSRLVLRLGMARLMRAGALITFAAGATLAALAWGGVAHWAAVVLPFAVFLYGTALILPNATSIALSPFPGSAGAVSSLMGAFSFTSAALISTLLGETFDGSARPMASVAAVCGVLAVVFERKLAHGKA